MVNKTLVLLIAIELSALLRFTDSDHSFAIYKILKYHIDYVLLVHLHKHEP